MTIDVNPAVAKIKLLNTPAKYKKDLMLKRGTYQIEITRDGYEPLTIVAEIKNVDLILPISLKSYHRG